MHSAFTNLTRILTIICFCLPLKHANAQCPPAIPSATFVANDSVYLQWSVAGAGNYEYAVLPASQPQPASGTPITTTSIGVGGLSNTTAYKVWLRTDCGSSTFTAWQSISFTTVCGVPVSINIDSITSTSAIVSWSKVGNNVSYEYAVTTDSIAPPASGTSTNNVQVLLSTLAPGQKFCVYVRTNCGGGEYSAWRSLCSYTKFPTGVNGAKNIDGIRVYPNPVTDILHITQSKSSTQPAQFVLTDIQGRVVYQLTSATEKIEINLGNYLPGLYLLKVKSEYGVKTMQINKL